MGKWGYIIIICFSVVWKYVLSSKTWTKIYDDKKFQSYCCFDISGDLVAMGNLDGVVVVFFIGEFKNFFVCFEYIWTFWQQKGGLLPLIEHN